MFRLVPLRPTLAFEPLVALFLESDCRARFCLCFCSLASDTGMWPILFIPPVVLVVGLISYRLAR